MRSFSTGEFYTDAKGKVPPLVTTPFITRDAGNSGSYPSFLTSFHYYILPFLYPYILSFF